MTNEDIIRLERNAGLVGLEQGGILENFQRFAALVAAAEREKIAAWMHGRGYATGHGDTIEDLLKELEWQVAERERIACVIACEEIAQSLFFHDNVNEGRTAQDCAAAIRARGEV